MSSDPEHPSVPPPGVGPKPAWLKVKAPSGAKYLSVRQIVEGHCLHTVCQSARCPNLGECWSAGTATLMILGDTCTRNCGFCGVTHGRPAGVDAAEPQRVADAVALMNLRYVVLTSVTRDDLADGGASLWADTVRAIRRRCPQTLIEVLPSDFAGRRESCQMLIDARPDVFGHNIETVPRLYPAVRPQALYDRSLDVLRWSAEAGLVTKSSLLVGLGEEFAEVEQVLRDLRAAGATRLAIGQYLRPSASQFPVARYVRPEEFGTYRNLAESLGFTGVASGPLVRSSYHAEKYAT